MEKEITGDNLIEKINLKKYSSEFYNKKLKEIEVTGVKFKYKIFPFGPYANVIFGLDEKPRKINLNLLKIKINIVETADRLFSIESNISHEFQHIKNFENIKKKDCYDYDQLLIAMEYLTYINIFASNNKFIDKIIKKNRFTKLLSIAKLFKFNEVVSATENKCNYEAYNEIFELHKEFLSDEKVEKYSDLVEYYRIMKDDLEIMKNYQNNYTHKMTFMIPILQKLIKKSPELIEEYKILQNLFKPDGSLINIYDLYQSINEKNKGMYDKIILNILMTVEMDLTEYLIDENFKLCIERLISNYNETVIHFYEQRTLIKNVTETEEIFSENFFIQKDNVRILNCISKKYNLNIDGGFVLNYKLK